MKAGPNILMRAGALVAAVLCAAAATAAERTVSVPSYLANPGAVVEVPVMLDNAAGLAGLRVQVNFDAGVLELLSAEPGPLGDAFEFSQGGDDGLVRLVFARAEALAGGSGRLALLRFRVNAGAAAGSYSEVAIADLALSDRTGVVDLRQKDTITIGSGMVSVTLDGSIDNGRNGLPDWWEKQHGLDLFSANAGLDTDGDGLPNLLEYAFGGNPLVGDKQTRGPQSGVFTQGAERYLTLGFRRRRGDASLVFRVQESSDLVNWSDLDLTAQGVGVPQDLGDGTEQVTVRGTIQVAAGGPKGFLRLKVEGK